MHFSTQVIESRTAFYRGGMLINTHQPMFHKFFTSGAYQFNSLTVAIDFVTGSRSFGIGLGCTVTPRHIMVSSLLSLTQ